MDLSHRIPAVTAWDQCLFQAFYSTIYRVGKERNLMTLEGPNRRHTGNSQPPVRQDLNGPHLRWCWDTCHLLTFQKKTKRKAYLIITIAVLGNFGTGGARHLLHARRRGKPARVDRQRRRAGDGPPYPPMCQGGVYLLYIREGGGVIFSFSRAPP